MAADEYPKENNKITAVWNSKSEGLNPVKQDKGDLFTHIQHAVTLQMLKFSHQHTADIELKSIIAKLLISICSSYSHGEHRSLVGYVN